MRSRKPFLIFWPQYFEARKTRSEGRRLPKNQAIDKVSCKEIAKAANRIGHGAQIESVLKYPRSWWEDSGRVVVNAKGKKKSQLMKEIANEIRKMR